MNKKLDNLLKLKQDLENRLSSPVPPKHKNHPETYINFLKNELEAVLNTINKLKGLS